MNAQFINANFHRLHFSIIIKEQYQFSIYLRDELSSCRAHNFAFIFLLSCGPRFKSSAHSHTRLRIRTLRATSGRKVIGALGFHSQSHFLALVATFFNLFRVFSECGTRTRHSFSAHPQRISLSSIIISHIFIIIRRIKTNCMLSAENITLGHAHLCSM